jgi:prepilin-type N-terminal cleavage/methylation domain-containing protein
MNATTFSRSQAASSAFSLLELLAVMAVVAIMMTTMLPALSGLKSASDVTKSAYDIAGTLEQARAYAMANNTYVYVGFAERDGLDSNKAGAGQVLMIAMASQSGQRGFGTDNTNLRPLSRLGRWENMHLADALPNMGGLSRPSVAAINRVANDAFAAQDTFTCAGLPFSKIIQFNPRGMASVQSNSASTAQWVEIGLVASHGGTVVNSPNSAALVLDGITGRTKIYRP